MTIKRSAIYTDLNLGMVPHPLTGDLTPKKDDDAIQQALRNVVLLEPMDIPFEPDKASGIRKLLFENAGQLTTSAINSTLRWLIGAMEPRVTVRKIEVNDRDNGAEIIIYYTIKSLMTDESFKFFVQRVR